jgi:hypothetical protein
VTGFLSRPWNKRVRTRALLRAVGLPSVCVIGFLLLPAAAAATEVTATIEVVPTATLNPDGSLTVTVIVACVPLDEYKGPPLAEVVVVQDRGSKVARGDGGTVVTCTNTPQTYELIVLPDEGSPRFRRGPATVTPIIGICGFLAGELVCERADSTPKTVILRRRLAF